MEHRREDCQGNRQSRSQLQEQRQVHLVDQTRPARRTYFTSPIQEGESYFYGQAGRYEEAESDSASLLHAGNLNPVIDTGVSSTQPVEASPSIGAPSQVVPSAGYTCANEQQAGDRHESFGVQFRSGYGCQSASGFSSYRMNEPSGGQLRSLPPASVLGPCSAPSRSGACVVPDQQLQSEGQALEDFLRNKLGCLEYERQRQKCYNSFKEAGKDHNTAYTCANLLLVYQIEFDAVKCSQCSGNGIDSEIEHSSDCVVKQAQIRVSSEGSRRQLEPRGTSGLEEVHEGGNTIQRTSDITHLVVEEVPAEDRIRLSLEDSAERTSEIRRETSEPQSVSGVNFQTAVVTQQGENFQTAVVTQQRENFQTVRVTQQGPTGDSETTQTKSLGINTALPKHRNYATVTLRLATYNGWPDSSSQTPQELSDAGFYYAGFGDCVRCFYCGIGFRHWAREDNPWTEHARWSRNCVYLRQMKGEEFVNLAQSALQYYQDNNTQTNEATGNESASQDVGKILLSGAAMTVLEMGYPVQMIKRAIEEILRENGNAKITAENLMEKVFEIEESEHTTPVKTTGAAGKDNGSVKAKCETKAGNESASKDIENILQSDAAKSVLEMGYQVQMIKRAIEEILRENGNAKITAENLMEKVFKIEESEHKTPVKTTGAAGKDNGSVKAKCETKALMNATICRVCRRETISVTQLLCGHIICLSCSQKVQEDKRCKLCGQEVVDLWPYDPSSKSYRL